MSLVNEILKEVIVANGAHVKNKIETINEKCTNVTAILFYWYCSSCMNASKDLKAIYYTMKSLEVNHFELFEELDKKEKE